MTREEAIEILHFQTFVVDFQTGKALEMAISALRQQETVTNRNGLKVVEIDQVEQMTNADRIRSMSDEELAQWLASKVANLKFLDIEMSGKQLTAAEMAALTHDLYAVFYRYLQQSAEEDDHV